MPGNVFPHLYQVFHRFGSPHPASPKPVGRFKRPESPYEEKALLSQKAVEMASHRRYYARNRHFLSPDARACRLC